MIDEGNRIVLKNDKDLLKIIKTESPDSYFEWTLNGGYISAVKDRVVFRGDNVVILKTNVNDTGVYVCMLYRVNKKRTALRVISLAVKPRKFMISTRKTYKLTLASNAVVLGNFE